MLCEDFIRAKAAAMAQVRQSNKPRKKPRREGGGGGFTRRDRSLSWEDLTPLCPPRPSPTQQQRDPGLDVGDRRRQMWSPNNSSSASSAPRRLLKHCSRENTGPGKSSSPFIVIPGSRYAETGSEPDGASAGTATRWMSPTSFSLRYDDIRVGSVEGAGPSARPERAGSWDIATAAAAAAGHDKAPSRHDAGVRPKLFHGGKDVPGDSLLLMTHPGIYSTAHSESLLNNYLRKKMEEIERAMLLSPGRSPQSLMARFQHLSLYSTEQPSLAAAGLENHERMGEEEVPSSMLSTPVLQISEENAQDKAARLHRERTAPPPARAGEDVLRVAAPSLRIGGCGDSRCSIEEDAGGQRLKSDSISKMLQRSISLPSLPALAVAPAGSASTLELYDQPTLAVLQRCRSATEYLQEFTSWDRDAPASAGAAAAGGEGAPCCGSASFSGDLGSRDLQISYG